MDFFQTVKRIGIFMICAQAVLHFKPAAKYEKYLKLLVNIMVLVQLLTPIMRVFSVETEKEFLQRIQAVRINMAQEMEELEMESRMEEKNVLNEIEKEIKTRINNIAEKYEVSIVSVQPKMADFAGKLVIYVKEKGKMQDITIHIDQVSTVSEAPQNNGKDEKLHMLSNEIASRLGIEEDKIEVLWYA